MFRVNLLSPDSGAHGLSAAPELTHRVVEMIQRRRKGHGTDTSGPCSGGSVP